VRRRLEAQKLVGKRFLVCSGADDKLVPYRCSEPFMTYFTKAAEAFPDLKLSVQDNVYPGTGHVFSEQMTKDAVNFIVESISTQFTGRRPGPIHTSPETELKPLRGKW